MLTADWIALGLVVVFLALGALVGFGKGLKFFTSGIFGIIIAVVVCYLTLGFVLNIEFVQDLLADFDEWLRGTGSVGTFFADINIGKIVAAIILFIIVQIVRIIIVKIIKGIAEIDNIIFKVINKILGAVFFVAVLAAITLIVFQIFAMIGGETYDNFFANLEGSVFLLDKICENNLLIPVEFCSAVKLGYGGHFLVG
ncbi:MAG: hypothetical protein LUD27_04640 [Clostridia bacterium]|nr:hypothetical protein [Clostridia bacterium]